MDWLTGFKSVHHLNWIDHDLLLVGCCNEYKETTLALFEINTPTQHGRLVVDLKGAVCPTDDEDEVRSIIPKYFTQYLPQW